MLNSLISKIHLTLKGVSSSLPSLSKRRLNQLRKRKTNLETRVNLLIMRRLSRFREGILSSEDFEKATQPERSLERVNVQIARIERLLGPRPESQMSLR